MAKNSNPKIIQIGTLDNVFIDFAEPNYILNVYFGI